MLASTTGSMLPKCAQGSGGRFPSIAQHHLMSVLCVRVSTEVTAVNLQPATSQQNPAPLQHIVQPAGTRTQSGVGPRTALPPTPNFLAHLYDKITFKV